MARGSRFENRSPGSAHARRTVDQRRRYISRPIHPTDTRQQTLRWR